MDKHNEEVQATIGSLDALVDEMGRIAFGMSKTEALEKKVCIDCKRSILDAQGGINKELFHSMAGVSEWRISATCELCYNKLFNGE